ncbi:SurA N-terminal domain-containing protein [Lampropedia aestuarii]|uniref:SurA N-terminal domain-containing protein n=1 Tax=Lampropedia aestuarii TaxID=2562762 RepID=UPI00246971E8|nr:SurA N-terminal domain-containing protein [Lampropedia aestuarii]MDH5856069.1 SurA N-terminal domain-containing protein [Lampropedia aestuarii]
MFDFIRKHLKVVMIVFFPLVIFAFVFVGMDPSMYTQRSPVVAKVGSTEITQNDWDFQQRNYADNARQSNPQLTSAELDSPQQRYVVLEGLVRDAVFAQVINDRNYVISNNQLARDLVKQPEIAALRGADGRMDMQGYRDLLMQYGMSSEGYEANVRRQLAMQQVLGIAQTTSILTPVQANLAVDAVFQNRNLQVKRFTAGDYAAQVAVTDEALKSFYDANQALFQRPEQVDIEYVVLDLQHLMDRIEINEEELRSYYENNKASYATSQEQRHARHILYAADTSMSQTQRDAVRAKADAALKQLREDPSRFEAIAKAESDDTGSKDSGGDLGFFGRGAMVADFDNAVFKMQPNDISEVIPTEYGYHIIELVDIKPAAIPAYEELRDRLAQDVKNNLARNQFLEQAETLRNIAHDQSDSLQPVADELGLSIQTAKGLSRTPQPDSPEVLQSAPVLQALFDSRATQDRENIDAVDIGNSQIITARVVQLNPAQVQPLDEVKDQVKTLLIEQESAQLARQAGEEALKAWKADAKNTEGSEAMLISRQQPQGLSPADVNAILTLPSTELPQVLGFTQTDGSYLVANVQSIAPLFAESMDEQQRTQLRDMYDMQVAQSLAAAETEAYYEVLKQALKVQIRAPRP